MSNDINQALGVSPPTGQPGLPVQPGKYSSLKNIAGIIAVMAWITGGFIMLAAIINISVMSRDRYGYRDNTGQSILIFLAYLYMGFFIVISLLAQSGIIKVLVDIEENTRKANSK
jgi:hypothetical protein